MRLIFISGLKSLASNLFRTILTILGIAIGITTVASVIMLDYNTHLSESKVLAHIQKNEIITVKSVVEIIPWDETRDVPTNQAKPTESVLEEDYQMMRSAVRLASLLAFFIGAIIVYYTIGFTIQQRKKELALLTALGATFSQVALIVLFEALIMGVIGSLLGLMGSWPIFKVLKFFNVTTTGRGRLFTAAVPGFEFGIVFIIGILTSLLGALQPIFKLKRLNVNSVLQPRFLADETPAKLVESSNLFSIIVPIMTLTYILMRPFLRQFIPSIYFYVGELCFIVSLFLLVVFFIPTVTAFLVKRLGQLFLKIFQLEVKLVSSRFSHFTQFLSWPISNVMLVFAFLLTLHLVTMSLKHEILEWGNAAVRGASFVEVRKKPGPIPDSVLQKIPEKFVWVRLPTGSPAPNKLIPIEKNELLKFRQRAPELGPVLERFDSTSIILSQTLAQNLGVSTDDWVFIKTEHGAKKFQILAITDRIGYVPGEGTYRERKSFALIEQANAFLLNRGETLPGMKIVIWNRYQPFDYHFQYDELVGFHKLLKHRVRSGEERVRDQVGEINKDFFIFDVILLLSTCLAGLGVTNTMLIQLQARQREIALLQVLGMTNGQILKMIIIEGFFIGVIGGLLAILLGIPIGWASIEALNVLSVFQVRISFSIKHFVLIFGGAILVTLTAALYPAVSSFRMRISESIHYE